MILEELVGSFVALFSNLVIQTPPISGGDSQRECTLISEANLERDEEFDGLIHCEYDSEQDELQSVIPYYEDDISILVQNDRQTRRNFCESFLRSCTTNIGLVMTVVVILGFLIVGIVYADLNTTNLCVAWIHNNFSIPSNVRNIRIVGMCISLLPLFAWILGCLVMLSGFKEFQNNYLTCLTCQLVALSIHCAYTVVFSDMIRSASVKYR